MNVAIFIHFFVKENKLKLTLAAFLTSKEWNIERVTVKNIEDRLARH